VQGQIRCQRGLTAIPNGLSSSHGQSLSQRPVFAADGRRLVRTDDSLDWLPVLHQHSAQINLCVLWDANRRTCPDSSSPTVLLRKRSSRRRGEKGETSALFRDCNCNQNRHDSAGIFAEGNRLTDASDHLPLGGIRWITSPALEAGRIFQLAGVNESANN